MARSLLIQAHRPDTYLYHAIIYAISIFNILPVKDVFDPQGNPATPMLLFTGSKPLAGLFCVFKCPAVARK